MSGPGGNTRGSSSTQQSPPTPAEAASLRDVATAYRAQNALQQQAAAASADQVIANANRHVAVNTQAPADDPAVSAFSSGPTIQPPAADIEVFVTASAAGGPASSSAPPVIVPPPPPPPGTPPVPAAPPPVVPPPPAPPSYTGELGSGEPAPPSAIPSVAPGPTPTGSTNTPPSVVGQQAASATARSTTPGATGVGSTGTTSAPTETAQVGNLQLSFEPNPHNQYDRVAYVFKLCMINDLDAEDPDLLNKFLTNKIRKIVIAESGVTTGFAIGDVEITDAISANFRNRSNMTTGLRIQIVEPYSLTLPDKMFQASQALGVRNWRLAPFLLQLEFRYIKSDGSLYTPSGTQKLVKVYQLLITEFDAQLTDVGTKYDVQAGVKGNLGFRDAYQILPQTHRVEVTGAEADRQFGVAYGDNRVGTFFRNLGNKISDMYVELREKNITGHKLPLMIYKFIVEPDLAKEEINFVPTANSRRNSFTVPQSTTGEILVSRGISVSALVDDLLASLKNPNFFIQNMDEGGLIKIPAIECVTRNVGWDLLTNDYVREFTFFIRLKRSNRPVPTSQYGQAVQSDPNLQQSRMQEVSKNLKKRYDYFYTGLNTEIINCDIKFNQMHIISQPLLQVTTPMTYASSNRVSPNDPNLTGEIPVGQLGQAQAQATQQLQTVSTQLQSLRASATPGDESGQAGILSGTEELARRRREAEKRLEDIAKASIVPFEVDQELRRLLGRVANTGAEAAQLRDISQRVATQNAARAATREFVEDINLTIKDNMLELSYYADPRDVQNSFARPTVIEAGGGNEQSGGPSQTAGTRPMVTSILSQIYDRPGQHLLEIDLEIRGDPYWLGITDLERTQELLGFLETIRQGGSLPDRLGVPTAGNTGSTSFSREGLVDKHDQDANILLKFRAGSPPKENTGFMDLNEGSTFFYGVYTVIECMHEFKSGKFTQRLKAFRDVLINVEQLRAADRTAISSTQPQQAPAVTAGAPNAEQTATNPSNAQLTNPNASAANIQRSQEATNVSVSPSANGLSVNGNSRQAQINADNEAILAQTRNENFVGGRGRAPDSGGVSLTGEGRGGASLTGEGGLRDPTQRIDQPRSLPNTRQATYDAATDTFGNTSVGPGETVDYGNASLQALGARRNSR